MSYLGAMTTRGGYRFDECTSSMQKCIRRGMEREAMFWAIEIEAGWHAYLWNRLEVIATEDIGIANPQAAILVYVLKQQYLDAKKRGNDATRLFLASAILFLCRSEKSRISDNFCIAAYMSDEKLEVPDFAKDKHTGVGRKMGRGVEHFVTEGAQVDRLAFDDPYRDEAVGYLNEKRQWRYASAHATQNAAGSRQRQQLPLGDDDDR